MSVHQHSICRFSAILISGALPLPALTMSALTLPPTPLPLVTSALLLPLLVFAPGLLIPDAFADLPARPFGGGLAFLVCLGPAAGLSLPNIGSPVLIRIRRALHVEGELR